MSIIVVGMHRRRLCVCGGSLACDTEKKTTVGFCRAVGDLERLEGVLVPAACVCMYVIKIFTI